MHENWGRELGKQFYSDMNNNAKIKRANFGVVLFGEIIFVRITVASNVFINIYQKNETKINIIPNMKNPIIRKYIMFSLCSLFQLGLGLFLSLNFK